MSEALTVVDNLKPFELEAIRVLAAHSLTADALAALANPSASILYRYSGSGYFVTIRDPRLPTKRLTCSVPPLVGVADNIVSGFVVFVGDGQLMLECHSWGYINVPADFRDRDVIVREPLPGDFGV
jgi:hypothetical protein